MEMDSIVPTETIVIDGKELNRIEYKGIKVLTTAEIAEHHGLKVKVLNQKFRRSKKHFIENEDYFVIQKSDVSESQIVTQKLFTVNNMSEAYLITLSGYFKLVKTINDDKAWKVYTQLVELYFAVKQLGTEKQYLISNKANRTGLTSEWARHQARDYRGLTLAEYQAIFNDISIRKDKMTSDQVTLLSAFECIESIKLKNNPDIVGDDKLKGSIDTTGTAIAAIVAPKQISK